ncbi:MAG: thioesterase family protein [Thermoanaerobaculia bacterium]
MDHPLAPGTEGSISITVRERDLASALGFETDDQFPPVLATSRMIALMELAAARVMAPMLKDGELSVGVTVDITHAAPTPLGSTARAVATFRAMEGKLFVFDVAAYDDAGEIGRGTHKRAIVATERLLAGAAKRKR